MKADKSVVGGGPCWLAARIRRVGGPGESRTRQGLGRHPRDAGRDAWRSGREEVVQHLNRQDPGPIDLQGPVAYACTGHGHDRYRHRYARRCQRSGDAGCLPGEIREGAALRVSARRGRAFPSGRPTGPVLRVDDVDPGRPHDDVVDVGVRTLDVEVMVDQVLIRQLNQRCGSDAFALAAGLEPVDPLRQAIGYSQRLRQLPANPFDLYPR